MTTIVSDTVFIVDDDEAVRDSLRWLLESARRELRPPPASPSVCRVATEVSNPAARLETHSQLNSGT